MSCFMDENSQPVEEDTLIENITEIVPNPNLSMIYSSFILDEAIESDGAGNDLTAGRSLFTDSDDESHQNENNSLEDFVVSNSDSDNDSNDDDSHSSQSDSNSNAIGLSSNLNSNVSSFDSIKNVSNETSINPHGTRNKRYYDLILKANNSSSVIKNRNISNIDSDDSDTDFDDSDTDSDSDSSSSLSSDSTSDSSIIENEETNDLLSNISTIDFQKLLSKTIVNLALEMEKNESKTHSNEDNNDPFITQKNEILFGNDIKSIYFDMDFDELLSFIDTDVQNDRRNTIISTVNMNNNLIPSNLKNRNEIENERYESEERRLANETFDKHCIFKKFNLEKYSRAPLPSTVENRQRHMREKYGTDEHPRKDTAGDLWFNMRKGQLTPSNKLHFLMLKYRHLLYRKYKPHVIKDNYIPRYFQMGTIIEGPTEYYSKYRIPKRKRKNSWYEQYLSNSDTKKWLEIKTQRALNRIRKPGKYQFWKAMNGKLNVNNRYKLRRKIVNHRKMQQKIMRREAGDVNIHSAGRRKKWKARKRGRT